MATSSLTRVSYMEKSSNNSIFWHEGGRSKIAKIYVSYGSNGVDGLQFAYIVNGKVESGEEHGSFSRSTNFDVVDFHCSEVVTALRGYRDRSENLFSFSVATNKGTYGPFGRDLSNTPLHSLTPFNFQLGDGSSFGGFHGTVNSNGSVQSIGVYFKTTTPFHTVK